MKSFVILIFMLINTITFQILHAGERLEQIKRDCDFLIGLCEEKLQHSIQDLINCAVCFELNENYKEAEKYYTDLILNDSKNSLLLERRANIYFNQGKYSYVIEDVNSALNTAKNNVDLLKLRAKSLVYLHKYDLALLDYFKIVEIHGIDASKYEISGVVRPWLSEIFFSIADVYNKKNENEKARKYYSHAVQNLETK